MIQVKMINNMIAVGLEEEELKSLLNGKSLTITLEDVTVLLVTGKKVDALRKRVHLQEIAQDKEETPNEIGV